MRLPRYIHHGTTGTSKVKRKRQFLIQSGSGISREKDAQHAASYEENKLICEYLLPPLVKQEIPRNIHFPNAVFRAIIKDTIFHAVNKSW